MAAAVVIVVVEGWAGAPAAANCGDDSDGGRQRQRREFARCAELGVALRAGDGRERGGGERRAEVARGGGHFHHVIVRSIAPSSMLIILNVGVVRYRLLLQLSHLCCTSTAAGNVTPISLKAVVNILYFSALGRGAGLVGKSLDNRSGSQNLSTVANAFHASCGVNNGAVVVVGLGNGVEFDLAKAEVYADADTDAVPRRTVVGGGEVVVMVMSI